MFAASTVFAVAEYGDRLPRNEYFVDHAVRPTHDSTHSSVPGISHSRSRALDVMEPGGRSGTMQTGGTDRCLADKVLVSSWRELEQTVLRPLNVDYCGSPSDSIMHCSGLQSMPGLDLSFTQRADFQRSGNRRSAAAGSSGAFLTDHYHSVSPTMVRSRSRSPVPGHSGQSPSRQSNSVPRPMSHSRRTRSPVPHTSTDFLTSHHYESHGGSSEVRLDHGSWSSVAAGDGVPQWFGSGSDTEQQSASSCRLQVEKQQQQQQSFVSTSSQLFAEKLAKLRALRYVHLPYSIRLYYPLCQRKSVC